LFLLATHTGRDPIQLRQLQPLAALLDRRQQRASWQELCGGAAKGPNEDKRISTVASPARPGTCTAKGGAARYGRAFHQVAQHVARSRAAADRAETSRPKPSQPAHE
jgi:hypothetical protein